MSIVLNSIDACSGNSAAVATELFKFQQLFFKFSKNNCNRVISSLRTFFIVRIHYISVLFKHLSSPSMQLIV